MPVPLPAPDDALLRPPDRDEVELIARGIRSASMPAGGLTTLQHVLIRAITRSMTGFEVDPTQLDDISPAAFAAGLARRTEEFRHRGLHMMLLTALILNPLPEEVASRLDEFAAELGVEDDFLRVVHDYSHGSLGLALIDFDRSGYTADWDPVQAAQLHTSRAVRDAWDLCVTDADLAGQWEALGACPEGSLGLGVFRFYQARGFAFPGHVGSAPPYLAQHDWVHVLAGYGSTVECEIEIFALIARAIPDPRGFSFLAMVIGLFETGYLSRAAGLFEADRGHLSQEGMAVRLGDALRRGALCGHDLLAVDWFAHAHRPVQEVADELGIVPKDPAAVAAGSITAWEPGGISPYQRAAGEAMAAREGRPYDSFGASVAT